MPTITDWVSHEVRRQTKQAEPDALVRVASQEGEEPLSFGFT